MNLGLGIDSKLFLIRFCHTCHIKGTLYKNRLDLKISMAYLVFQNINHLLQVTIVVPPIWVYNTLYNNI